MADILMWHQGAGPEFKLPDCQGGPSFTCPQSKRIAAEYARDFYFLTNVLNPNWDNTFNGRHTWQNDLAADVKAGDTIWFVLVPPKHTVYDIAAYAEATLTEASSLTSLAGMTADLVTAVFNKAAEDGTCEPVAAPTVQASLSFPAGAAPEEVFVTKKLEVTTTPVQWIGVGLKVTAMPTGSTTLEDIRSKIVVGAHVFGYDAQTHM